MPESRFSIGASPPRQVEDIGSEAAACDDVGKVIDDAACLISRLSRQDFLRLGEEARTDRIEAAAHLASVLDEPFDIGRACRAVRCCWTRPTAWAPPACWTSILACAPAHIKLSTAGAVSFVGRGR